MEINWAEKALEDRQATEDVLTNDAIRVEEPRVAFVESGGREQEQRDNSRVIASVVTMLRGRLDEAKGDCRDQRRVERRRA